MENCMLTNSALAGTLILGMIFGGGLMLMFIIVFPDIDRG